MLNTAPNQMLARRTRQLLLIGYVVVALGAFLAATGIVMFVVPFTVPGTLADALVSFFRYVLFIGGLVVVVGGIVLAVRALTLRRDNNAAAHTGDLLSRRLDGRYRFIRNINTGNVLIDDLWQRYFLRRARLGYIDAVLVGPPGVLVFRIMSVAGRYYNEKGGWIRMRGSNDRRPTRVNPTKDVIADVKDVREFLARNNLRDVPVYGVVVFTQPPPKLLFELNEPLVPVAYEDRLVDTLANSYFAAQRIDASLVERITNLLLEAI